MKLVYSSLHYFKIWAMGSCFEYIFINHNLNIKDYHSKDSAKYLLQSIFTAGSGTWPSSPYEC